MKTALIIMLIALSTCKTFAQTDLTFKKEFEDFSARIFSLEKSINELQQANSKQVLKIENLKSQLEKVLSENIKIREENQSIRNSQSSLEKQYQTFTMNFDTHKQTINNAIENLHYEVNTNSTSIKSTINELSVKIEEENQSIKSFQSSLENQYQAFIKDFDAHKQTVDNAIDGIHHEINTNSASIQNTGKELGTKIENTKKSTNQSITNLSKTVSQNTLYWIIAILVVALSTLLLFVLLRQQIFKQKTDLDSNLKDTRKVLEEEGVKLDNKLIEVLETQLKIINNSSSDTEEKADHSLALKVADEIIRIQKNLTRMDGKTKGLKQLTASVKRIQDNFASNGYELVEMLGKPFNEGMKVSANFIPDEDLEAGQQIITRIIKPQVNYKGVMIQSAQIEVSQG